MVYNVLLAIHFLSVSAFFGSVVCVHALTVRSARRTSDATHLGAAIFLDRFLVSPCAGLVTATGLILFWLRNGNTGSGWLKVLVAGWVILAIVGAGYLAPKLRWLVARRESENTTKYRASIRRWERVSALAIAGLVALFCLAILKPSLIWIE
jgi:uncharacterized membrane protein